MMMTLTTMLLMLMNCINIAGDDVADGDYDDDDDVEGDDTVGRERREG